MSAALFSRVSGGGITKRTGGGGRGRVDRDGDLDMDAPANRGRGRGGARRGGPVRPININNAPKGPAADWDRATGSGSGAMRARGNRRDPVGTRTSRRTSAPSSPVVGVKVYGWKESKGSAEECVRFLERKTGLKFRKTQKQGDCLVLFVPTSQLQAVLDWDKAKFAGVNIRITSDVVADLFNTAMEDATPQNSNTVETIKVLEEVLRLRYNAETKFLDLSRLGEDQVLQKNGFFAFSSTTSKMFPALMAVADKKFDTAQEKRDAVHSVTLAGNNLTSITAVTTLSITFPDLKNLSLEANMIEDLKSLDGWRSRFRSLEQLILIGNPVTAVPTYREEMIHRYPKLIMLDNVAVERPQIGDQTRLSAHMSQKSNTITDAAGRPVLPLSTKGNLLVDTNGLAMSFLSDFFTQIDNNKDTILAKFYTPESKFSMAVNTSAPRVEALQNERQYWDMYIPKSRNMKRIRPRDDAKIFNALAQGPVEIRELWKSLPATLHNPGNQELWSFDIIPVEISPGVNGLLATVHSEFEEANSSSGSVVKRSFDRNFTLWIDPSGTNIKVVSEMLTIRSYAGATAFKVDSNSPVAPVVAQATPTPVAAPAPAAGGSVVNPAEAEERRQKCQMLAEKSGLNLKFAEMCLADTNWELAAAWDAFAWAKENGKLGPDAWAT